MSERAVVDPEQPGTKALNLVFFLVSDKLTLFHFSLSVCVRYVHRLSHLSADDTHMWDGNVWCIQGMR